MTLDEMIDQLCNARISDEAYESDLESGDQLRASVDGLVLPIESVEVTSEGMVLIHVDMYAKEN